MVYIYLIEGRFYVPKIVSRHGLFSAAGCKIFKCLITVVTTLKLKYVVRGVAGQSVIYCISLA